MMDEKILTHRQIDHRLCGDPVLLEKGRCILKLKTIPEMVADPSGLIHGGFVFGMADYAAMLAVNHPNVVLGSADVQFTQPVKLGDELEADAAVENKTGKKQIVTVSIRQKETIVFTGRFICFVLDKHVLG
jgi:acyl-coenzyme A thioesterase PaaI-like protein